MTVVKNYIVINELLFHINTQEKLVNITPNTLLLIPGNTRSSDFAYTSHFLAKVTSRNMETVSINVLELLYA